MLLDVVFGEEVLSARCAATRIRSMCDPDPQCWQVLCDGWRSRTARAECYQGEFENAHRQRSWLIVHPSRFLCVVSVSVSGNVDNLHVYPHPCPPLSPLCYSKS